MKKTMLLTAIISIFFGLLLNPPFLIAWSIIGGLTLPFIQFFCGSINLAICYYIALSFLAYCLFVARIFRAAKKGTV